MTASTVVIVMGRLLDASSAEDRMREGVDIATMGDWVLVIFTMVDIAT